MVGEIEGGLLVLLAWAGGCGGGRGYLADRIVGLRIFGDAAGRMNLSVVDSGCVLVVATLYGDTRKGRRPGLWAAHRNWHGDCTSGLWVVRRAGGGGDGRLSGVDVGGAGE